MAAYGNVFIMNARQKTIMYELILPVYASFLVILTLKKPAPGESSIFSTKSNLDLTKPKKTQGEYKIIFCLAFIINVFSLFYTCLSSVWFVCIFLNSL